MKLSDLAEVTPLGSDGVLEAKTPVECAAVHFRGYPCLLTEGVLYCAIQETFNVYFL